jgi:hypothetical protein
VRPLVEPSLGDEALLQQLKGTSDSDITAKTRAAYPFSAEDDENHQRYTKSADRETQKNIRHRWSWFLFYMSCGVVVISVAAMLAVAGYYLSNILFGFKIAQPAALADLFEKAIVGTLATLGTLVIDRQLKKRDE